MIRLTGFVCLFVASAWAQTDQGGITGTISDPTGAAVPGAIVEVKNSNTGAISHSRVQNGSRCSGYSTSALRRRAVCPRIHFQNY